MGRHGLTRTLRVGPVHRFACRRRLRRVGAGVLRLQIAAGLALILAIATLSSIAVPVASADPLGQITEFTAPSSGEGIVAGPDGNLWFTEWGVSKIGRITTAGVATDFPIPTPDSEPTAITKGPDGNLWFAEQVGNNIGRITTAGNITEFPIPTPDSYPEGITAGPDGNLWFTDTGSNRIGRITPAGTITEFPIPTNFTSPWEITAGPDGNLWFAEAAGNKIGRITPAGTVTEFPLPTAGSLPLGITAGPDGNVWFTEAVGNRIGRITPAGTITEFPTGNYPYGITAGPDGNLWFAEQGGDKIGRITTAGSITEFPILTNFTVPWQGITAGPDGNVWFTFDGPTTIGKIGTGVAPSQPPPPGCSRVLVLAARGVGEAPTNNSIGDTLTSLVNTVRQRVGSTNLKAEGVPYPTSSLADLISQPLNGRGFYSVDLGAATLGNIIAQQRHCGTSESILLAGYSEGAWVIHRYLAGNPTTAWAQVKGVALFGDPLFDPTSITDNGTFDHTKYGVVATLVGHQSPYLPPVLQSHTRSYCLAGDPICNWPQSLAILNQCRVGSAQCAHYQYPRLGYTLSGGNWLANQL